MSRSFLLLLVLLAGCAKSTVRPGAQFRGPAGVVVFQGYTGRTPATLGTYVAVAEARSDELSLINAADDTVVLSQTLVAPLSIPVDPRPALLAAGSLYDVDASTPPVPVERPWLLVSSSTGMVTRADPLPGEPVIAARVQVVDTWSSRVTVRPELAVDFGAIPGVEEQVVLSVAVVHQAVDDGGGGATAAPGAARLIIGASGGKLVVVEFTRGADGLAVQRGAIAVQDLGFEPLSLAASPDLRHLYVASSDPIGGVEGVAELDMTGAVGAWTVRGLDAHAPTTHVVAGMVGEFTAFTQVAPFDPYDNQTRPSNASNRAVDVFGAPALRVYAALDRNHCGRFARISCGVAVIDPATGTLVADPAPAPTPGFTTPNQDHLTPIEVPGLITGLAFVPPSQYGPPVLAGPGIPNPPLPSPLMIIAPGSGQRYTTAVVAVATTEGRVYLADVGHWAVPSDVSIINTVGTSKTTNRTRVVQAASALPLLGFDPVTKAPLPQPEDVPFIGLWSDSDLPAYFTDPVDATNPKGSGLGLKTDHLYDAPNLTLHPWVTPGYTPSEVWNITFQGPLPGLRDREGQVSSPGSGSGWVAMQADTGLAGGNPLRGVTNLYDPALGVHAGDGTEANPGDIVVIQPEDATACPQGAFEVEVTGFLYPSAAYPGGALQVVPRTVCHDGRGLVVPCPGVPTCLDGMGVKPATLTIRSSAMVLTGAGTGYAGRPPVVLGPIGTPLFRLEYEDENALTCPVQGDVAWPPPPCDAACRGQCERLALARKARRFTYVTNSLDCSTWPNRSDKSDCQSVWRNLTWPISTGPVLAFRVGLFRRDLDPEAASASNTWTARDAFLQLITASGVQPAARMPRLGQAAIGAALPGGMAVHDSSTAATADRKDAMRVYVAFPANAVLDFSPANGTVDVTTIR